MTDDDRGEYLFGADTRRILKSRAAREMELPRDPIPVRAYNSLMRHRVRTVGQLADMHVGELLDMRNVGMLSVRELQAQVSTWASKLDIAPAELAGNNDGAARPIGQAADSSGRQDIIPIGGATWHDARLDEEVGALLPARLLAWLGGRADVAHAVGALDRRFGLGGLRYASAHSYRDMTLADVVRSPLRRLAPRNVDDALTLLTMRIEHLVDRVERPIPLALELDEILPPSDRNSAIARSRWGWDGTPPKTLDETGRAFRLTRERVRQIEKKVRERSVAGLMIYLPTAEAILMLLRELGGAAYEDELGAAAVERGLALHAGEVAALERLSAFGMVSSATLDRSPDEGPSVVVSLSPEDRAELRQMGAVARRTLARRGIATVAEVVDALAEQEVPATEREVRTYVERMQGVEYLGGRAFFWHVQDVDSAFVRRIEKPLVTLGPLNQHAIARVLRRMQRRETYGPVIPATVLREALERSPYFIPTDDGRWTWTGPLREVQLGIAEQALLDAFHQHGPVLTYGEIQDSCQHIEGVTLAVALAHSPLVERLAHGVYALTGTHLEPGDVKDASERARARPPAVRLVDHSWDDGKTVVTYDITDRRRWSGVLSVPMRLGLGGAWTLDGRDETWPLTVDGASMWGGLGHWMSAEAVDTPARIALRFDPRTRTVEPHLVVS